MEIPTTVRGSDGRWLKGHGPIAGAGRPRGSGAKLRRLALKYVEARLAPRIQKAIDEAVAKELAKVDRGDMDAIIRLNRLLLRL
jgi:hypothetical protein